ncbi:LacI family DNA-binding transcriptional regulator [soil metagenome]
MTSRVTMADVGRVAGVSHQTVSRAINEPHRVTEETRQRVDEAIKSLRYRRSSIARALATNRTKSIGLLSTGVALHSHSKRMIVLNEAARASGYQVSMASLPQADRDSMQAALDAFSGQGIEGVVLIVADKTAYELIDSLDIDVPYIIADSGGSTGIHNMAINQFLGGRIATAHLADLGHTQIAHIAGPDWSLDGSERLRGWRAELESRGLPVPEPFLGDWSSQSGYERGLEIVAQGVATAVVCGNDRMSLGLIHALADSGLRVPDDISVIGFDDISESAHFLPPLTTVRQDIVQLGFQIMDTLLSLIEDEGTAPLQPEEPELIIRASTAPPRG